MTDIVTINCDGILCDEKFVVTAPEEWVTGSTEYGGESNAVFCPKCAPQNEWFRAVCPGCVSGFPDCGLGKAFMYSNSPGLTGDEALKVEQGHCPFRVNGTMSFTLEKGIQKIDLSEAAPSESGIRVINAINAYIDEYGPRENT